MSGKIVYYLDGTAACFKSSILTNLYQNNVCFTSSSDLTLLRNEFPELYTRTDGIQFNTISWYSMYQTQLFLNGEIGKNYKIMCCDRSPVAPFVYGIVNKKGEKLSVPELQEIIPSWMLDYFKSSNVLILIDSDIKSVKERLLKRNGFDTNLATDEYFLLQNYYFKSIAEICNIMCLDISGKTFSDVYTYIENWILYK